MHMFAMHMIDAPTFYVEDADLSKEVAITQYSKLSDSIICHHSQLPLFNDVHLVPYITFPTYILSRVVHLHKWKKETTVYYTAEF